VLFSAPSVWISHPYENKRQSYVVTSTFSGCTVEEKRFPGFNPTLIYLWMCRVFNAVPKYLNFTTFSDTLLTAIVLWICPACWQQDINIRRFPTNPNSFYRDFNDRPYSKQRARIKKILCAAMVTSWEGWDESAVHAYIHCWTACWSRSVIFCIHFLSDIIMSKM